MKVDYIEETSVRKALAFEVDKELVQAEIDRRAKDLAKKARLPGFRPGKTPPDVVKRRFRSEIFSETAEALVNKVVFEELEGRGLKPLAAPQVEGLKIEEGQPMTFRADPTRAASMADSGARRGVPATGTPRAACGRGESNPHALSGTRS